MNLINACNHGYTCLYTMNVVNTQLPQLYYNYKFAMSVFYCYLHIAYFSVKHLGGHNEHAVFFGRARTPSAPKVPPQLQIG